MSKQKNTLLINGQVFDSRTGTMGLHQAGSIGISIPTPSFKTIDGFRRRSIVNDKPQAYQKIRNPGYVAKKIHAKKQASKTLMRTAVTQPKRVHAKAISVRLVPAQDSRIKLTVGNAKKQIWAKRLDHSKQINQSDAISRFYVAKEPTLTKKTEPLDFKEAPVHEQHNNHISSSTPALELNDHDIFTNAIKHASSHKQAAPKPKHKHVHHRAASKVGLSPKAANIGAITLIVVALAGFIAYQNQANLSLRLASSRAGIHASLPGYNPSGFALGRNIANFEGQVVLNFHSNSDSRNYSISQSSTNWDSQTLQDDFVATSAEPYQKVNAADGKTVFLYGDANATWVDAGTWYKIEGDSSLTSDQLLKIANSF